MRSMAQPYMPIIDKIYHGNLRYIKVENVKTSSQDYLPVFVYLDEEKGQYIVKVFRSKYERIATYIMSTWVHDFEYEQMAIEPTCVIVQQMIKDAGYEDWIVSHE